MKTFKIPVVYQLSAICLVEAETLDQAENKVLSRGFPLPTLSHFIEDSLELDTESEFYGDIEP